MQAVKPPHPHPKRCASEPMVALGKNCPSPLSTQEASVPFIDYGALKERVSMEQAVQMLGSQLRPQGHQLRGACPICRTGGDRALVITPAKGLFYCFAGQTGGDQIALAAHVKA